MKTALAWSIFGSLVVGAIILFRARHSFKIISSNKVTKTVQFSFNGARNNYQFGTGGFRMASKNESIEVKDINMVGTSPGVQLTVYRNGKTAQQETIYFN